jgi:vacuolar-type H+-ATPase subunit E/Vma4
MSLEQDDIQALARAIKGEANEEAQRILADAQSRADAIRQQGRVQVEAERKDILQHAQREAENVQSNAVATAQLEAQTLKLERREQLLHDAFNAARQQLSSAPHWPDYEQIVLRLVREAAVHLHATEAVVRADTDTRRILSDEALSELGKELDIHLQAGQPLADSTGVVLETPDGHRRYDNTLQTRLSRMQESMRTTVYRILVGEMA